jgi:hypothetical protein
MEVTSNSYETDENNDENLQAENRKKCSLQLPRRREKRLWEMQDLFRRLLCKFSFKINNFILKNFFHT